MYLANIICVLLFFGTRESDYRIWHIRFDKPIPSMEAFCPELLSGKNWAERGASMELSDDGRVLTVRNTYNNLNALHACLLQTYGVPTVQLHAELLAIEPELAARWGLNGADPTDPDDMPVKGPLIPLLDFRKAAVLLARLRAHDQVQILASMNGVNDASSHGTFELKSTSTMKQVIDGSWDDQELGASLAVSCWLADNKQLDKLELEVEASWRAFAGWAVNQIPDSPMKKPVYAASSVKTDLRAREGMTFLMPGGIVRPAVPVQNPEALSQSGKCLLWLFTPRVITPDSYFTIEVVE